jgi:DNA helicase-2/ATP-dependent DNA helicase PcrA
MLLETNYRCASNIAEAAGRIISRNKKRYAKNMKAVRGQGKIYETRLHDAKQQYRHLLSELRSDLKASKQVAVLYRNNESAVPLADLLEREGVPFAGDIGVSFFGHPVARDMLYALRLASNPIDLQAYREIYYKLGLYTTKSQFALIKEAVERHEQGAILEILAGTEGRRGISDRALELGKAMRKIAKMRPLDALIAIDNLFYREWMKKKAAESGDSIRSMEQKLDTLFALSMDHDTVEEFLTRMEQLRLMGSENQADSRNTAADLHESRQSGSVLLSTIHSSKGMEFDKVILIDVYQGILPSENAGAAQIPEDDRREEEVRLFYVALTRAKDEIEVITAPKRFGRRIEPSPFTAALFEKSERPAEGLHTRRDNREGGKKDLNIRSGFGEGLSDAEEDKYQPGARLVHKYFGAGIIINRTGDILSIRFDTEGDKKMLLSGCLKWKYTRIYE